MMCCAFDLLQKDVLNREKMLDPQKSREIERLTFQECPIITLLVCQSIRGQLAKMATALKFLGIF